MTTRKTKKSAPHKKKPALPRNKSDRSGETSRRVAKGKPETEEPVAQADIAGQAPPNQEAELDGRISDFVKSASDALSATIGQSRTTAEQFRQGEYNFRQVPSDVEEMARRMLQLARQLSSTTFDVCDQLIGQLSTLTEPPTAGSTKVDPFRRHQPAGGLGAAPPTSTAPPNSGPQMRMAVEFKGSKKASSTSTSIERPAQLTRPEDLRVTPLVPVEGKAASLKTVAFQADLQHGGVTATVSIPSKQAAATYVGYVHTIKDKTPLGMLVVTIAK